jgi:hypothetical protein
MAIVLFVQVQTSWISENAINIKDVCYYLLVIGVSLVPSSTSDVLWDNNFRPSHNFLTK